MYHEAGSESAAGTLDQMKTSQPLVDETVASMLLRYPDHEVHPFQREILDTWLRPDVRVAGWSAARGAAKTAWAARAVAEYLSGPLAGDGGEEIAVVASSHAQASILMRDVSTRYLARDLARHGVGGQGRSRGRYRVIDNSNNLLIEDHQTRMRARVVGSDSRRAHGLRCRVIIADEPAQWGPRGELLWSSLVTGLGKVEGSRLLSIGTRPADDSHFFARFLDHARPDEGTVAVVHAADRDADPFGWESVQAANPGLDVGLPSARLLRQELAAARRDPAALQTWRALRLNQGVTDVVLDGDLLCPAEEFAAALTNDVPDPAGPSAWGIDLGGSRSMSAVAAYWPRSGLVKVRAALPTVPDLDIRGRQDGARDLYRRAVASGELVTSGERLCDVAGLLAGCARDWGPPMVVVADRHRYAEVLEVLDRFPPVEVVWRHRRVTDGAADVAIFRSALDGRRLKVSPRQELLVWSLSQARTKRNVGGQDYVHSGRGSRRDDLAVALLLAVGEGERRRIAASRPAEVDIAIRIPSPVAP